MTIMVQNKITQLYLDNLLSKNSVLYLSIGIENIEDLKKIDEQLLYYTGAVIKVSFQKDYNKLSEVIKYDSKDVRIIVSVSNGFERKYLENLCRNKKKDFKVLDLRSIPKARALVLLESVLTETVHRSYKEELLGSIYSYLLYTSKVDFELQIISKLRTVTSIKEYLKKRRSITNNTYVYKLLIGKNLAYLGDYLIENSNNINYVFKILENYISEFLEVYPYIFNRDLSVATLNSFSETKLANDKNYSPAALKQYLDVSTKISYSDIFMLNTKIKKAKTYVMKKLIYKELLYLVNTN